MTACKPGVSRRGVMRGFALLGGTALAGLMTGCGFKLRGNQSFVFETISVSPSSGGGVAGELRQALGSKVREPQTAVETASRAATAQVALDLLSEQRERIVVGLNASGQVRELQLRVRIKFRLRNALGKELLPETEILQQREISFSESAVLAKEAEEALLYRDMQSDIVQQLLRRLESVKALD